MNELKLPIKTVLEEFSSVGFGLVYANKDDYSPYRPGGSLATSRLAYLLCLYSAATKRVSDQEARESVWHVIHLINKREGIKKPSLWSAKATEYLARVWQHGQQKHGGGAATPVWQQQSPARHLESAWRHFVGHSTEDIDPESGLPHLAHLLFRLMAYQWVLANGTEEKQA